MLPSFDPHRLAVAVGLLVPGIAAAYGGEGALLLPGETLAMGLVVLMCLLVSVPIISRAIAFVVGLVACAVV